MYGNSKSNGGLGKGDRGTSRRDFLKKAGNLGVASLAGAAALVANAEESGAKTTSFFKGKRRVIQQSNCSLNICCCNWIILIKMPIMMPIAKYFLI